MKFDPGICKRLATKDERGGALKRLRHGRDKGNCTAYLALKRAQVNTLIGHVDPGAVAEFPTCPDPEQTFWFPLEEEYLAAGAGHDVLMDGMPTWNEYPHKVEK